MLVHAVYWGEDRTLKLPSVVLAMFAFAGQRGVQLFFIVSAFTLFMSASNRTGTERNPVLNFFIRRIFRITPMLYTAAAIAFFVWRDGMGSPFHIALSLVYLGGFHSSTINSGAIASWSIETEAVFYMLFPLLFRFIKTPYRVIAGIAVVGAFNWLILGRLVSMAGASRGFWFYTFILPNLPIFGLGILGFFIWDRFIRPTDGELSAIAGRKTLSAALLLCTVGLYVYSLPFYIETMMGESIILLLFVLSVLIYPWSFFVNRFTIMVGKLSFSLYLLHPYVSHIIEPHLDRFGLAHHWAASPLFLFFAEYTLCIGITLPLSALTYTWIEAPAIRFGQRLIRKLEGRGARPVDTMSSLTQPTDIPAAQF